MNCKFCGEKIEEEHRRGPKRKYCSSECRYKARYEQIKTKTGGGIYYKKQCPICQKNFITIRVKQIYCSRVCKCVAGRTIKGIKKQCLICGKEFEITTKSQKTCSLKCGAQMAIKSAGFEMRRLNRKKTSEESRKRICEVCGKEFIANWPGGRINNRIPNTGRFCSNECKWKFRAKLKVGRYYECAFCKVYSGQCVICDEYFTSKYKKREICSK